MVYLKLIGYVFDENGVRDIQRLMASVDAKFQTTYNDAIQAFDVKGDDVEIAKHETCIQLFRDYVRRHEHENLLDGSPIHRMYDFHRRTVTPRESSPQGDSVDTLLDLKDDVVTPAPEPEPTPSESGVVKIWQPSIETDYLASDKRRLLSALGHEHGVEISVEASNDATPQIRVSGKSDDVNKAIAALGAIEKPVYLAKQPYRGLILIAPHHESCSFSIVRYSSISHTALRRILVGRDSPMARDVPEMLVPVLCFRDMIVSNIDTPMNVRAKSEVIRAWQNHSFSEFGSRNRHPKPVPSPQEELVSLPSIHDLEDRPLELNEQVQRLENAKANVTSVIEDELVAPKRPPGIKIRKVLPRTRIRPGTDPDSDLLSNVDDTSRSGVKPIKMQEAQPTTGVLIDLVDTQTESLPIVRHENDAWAMSFLLKQIQASPLGSAVNEITRSSADTHLDLLHASSASPIPAEANTEGEIREQLAAVDETPPILHSVMRNKSGRQRFFGWRNAQDPPTLTLRIEPAPDLERDFPPLVGTDLQAERHSIGRGVSTERRRQIESLFRALKPLLETAGEYPGILSLEFQLGLVLIPRPPQKLEGRYKDVERLQTKLSPRAGLPAPATVFFERLTTSAADIDYIVDLEVNGVRLFATQPDLREVRYEFHCESKGGDLVVNVYPDRGGNHLEILTPSELLGSVHISFPGHVWDAAAALRGQMKQSHGIDRETEDRVKNLFSALWAKPEEGRVRLHTHIPDDKLSVKKVLVKRCTRYRHCRREDIKLGFYADQDLFLQVTETQDLIINHYKGGHIEAYYAPDSQMISEQRQWWEASIISPVLNSSLNPEKGRQNTLLKPWEVSGLLGSDRGLVSNDIDDSAQTAFTAEKVGPAGPAGLGGLLDLTDAVVKNIDGVGYWNSGPCATPSRTSTTHDAAVGGLVRPSYSMISSGPEPPLNPDKGLIRVPKTSERGANAEGSVADPTFW